LTAPYRDDDPMRCDCGQHPMVLEVYWKGTERERRICHHCTPEILRIETRCVDPAGSGETFTITKNLAMRWGADQEHAVKMFQAWKAAQAGETVILNEPEPQERPKGLFARLFHNLPSPFHRGGRFQIGSDWRKG